LSQSVIVQGLVALLEPPKPGKSGAPGIERFVAENAALSDKELWKRTIVDREEH